MKTPGPGDALLIVDVQNDFLPGGALGVQRGDEVVAPLNRLSTRWCDRGLPIVFTRDWHPADHCSFHAQGGPWPVHCVAGTPGAEFASGLIIPADALITSKATDPRREAYSAFEGTGLAEHLRRAGVTRVFIGGLATDFCVRATGTDARLAGLELTVLTDAVRAVDVHPGDGDRALQELAAGGTGMTTTGAVLAAMGGQRMTRDPAPPCSSALLTDLYQLTMVTAYHELGMEQKAVFEFFVRKMPPQRGFLMAAGLEQVLDYLEGLRFEDGELRWLEDLGRFKPAALRRLAGLRFTGDVDAMPEGSVFFADEPVLRVIAPLPEAQLVESRIINLLNFQSLIATKAARCRLAAGRRGLADFGMRRAHGAEAALLAARACYVAGFDATATVEAGRQFGIPLTGTMAHSFIQAHDDETAAFRDFARVHPRGLTLLIDTYDTVRAARKVTELVRQGVLVEAVRLDSGDLLALSREVRNVLDAGGCETIRIVASGNLDEFEIERVLAASAPIDAFGVGTRLDVSVDAPYLDCVYKLQEYAGRPRRKRSSGKATWPGRKQVYREVTAAGRVLADVIGLVDEALPGRPMLQDMSGSYAQLNGCSCVARSQGSR